jgi:anti-sigma factor RsiW
MSGAVPPPTPPQPPTLGTTPNAERYILEADVMRRRQLRAALLHGTRRSWRETNRAWPAVVVGLILAAVVVAGLAVVQALDKTKENQREQEREQGRAGTSLVLRLG